MKIELLLLMVSQALLFKRSNRKISQNYRKNKKKIGIDIVETKPEVLQADVTEDKTEEKDLPKETKVETKKKVKSETKKESSEEKK